MRRVDHTWTNPRGRSGCFSYHEFVGELNIFAEEEDIYAVGRLCFLSLLLGQGVGCRGVKREILTRPPDWERSDRHDVYRVEGEGDP